MTAAVDWTPSDHFGLWQLIVAGLGFGIAIWQLIRTANATSRSRDLLERRLLSNDLLILLPELHRLEDDLDAASKTENKDVIGNALVAYARRASGVVGHLKTDPTLKDEKVVKLLTASTRASTSAKGELLGVGERTIQDTIRSARDKIATANAEVSELIARLQKGADIR